MTVEWRNFVSGYRGAEPLHVAFNASITTPGIYAVVGPNGCGKSTFLKTTLGLMPPLQGEIFMCNQKVESGKTLPRGVGFVPQVHGVNKYFDVTVRELVMQGCGRGQQQSGKERVELLLREWDVFRDADKRFHSLSVGQKTRALVARALACDPKILFLDEPLANLDIHCQGFLLTTLQRLVRERELVVLVVDHHFEKFQKHINRFIHFTRTHGHDEKEHVDTRSCYIHFHDSLTELAHEH